MVGDAGYNIEHHSPCKHCRVTYESARYGVLQRDIGWSLCGSASWDCTDWNTVDMLHDHVRKATSARHIPNLTA